MRDGLQQGARAFVVVAMAFGRAAGLKTRREYVEHITTVACARYDTCGRIGPGRDFRSVSECNNTMLWKMYDQWPEADCDGQINETRFAECARKADAIACDDNFVERVAAFNECEKARICVDKRQQKTIYPSQFGYTPVKR